MVSPYVQRALSVELKELGNIALCRHPLGASKLNWGNEMAFLIIGEMSGVGDDVSREPLPGLTAEFFRMCRKARMKKPIVLVLFVESGLPGSLKPP